MRLPNLLKSIFFYQKRITFLI